MKRNRIPSTWEKFITYIIVVNDYLHSTLPGDTEKRGIVLGMTTAELTALANFVKSMVSGDPVNPGIWDLHKNKDTKTQKTTAEMKQAKKEFGAFFRPLLNRMNLSANIKVGDRIPLEISDPNPSRKVPKLPIEALCFVYVILMGHGVLKAVCRQLIDGSRASRPATANGVEVAYAIAVESSDSADATPITSIPEPDTIETRRVSSKPRFTLTLGPEYVGKTVYMYFRWVNTKYPNLAGNWSKVLVTLVS